MKLSKSLAAAAILITLIACGRSSNDVAQNPNDTTSESAAAPESPPVPASDESRQAREQMATVPAGTVLTLSLDKALSSDLARSGDPFTATVVEAVRTEDGVVIPEGSTIEGKVTEAVAARRGAGKGKLALDFEALRLPSGYRTEIVGSFQKVSASQKKRNAAIIGGSAAGGAVLGRILGKNTKGAVIGTIVGGGVGTAVVMGKEGTQARMAANAPFALKLQESVRVPA